MRIDLACRDIQGIEAVADEHEIIQPLPKFSVRPHSLGEAGAEEVVRHAPVNGRKEWERGNQRPGAGNARVTSGEGQGLAELPADVPGHDDRSGPGRRPDGEAVSRPRVEDVATQD